MADFFVSGTKEGDALAALPGPEALSPLRLALRRASYHDKIGDAHAFRALYSRIGGSAPEMSLLVESEHNERVHLRHPRRRGLLVQPVRRQWRCLLRQPAEEDQALPQRRQGDCGTGRARTVAKRR
jgi:hypothetical protein